MQWFTSFCGHFGFGVSGNIRLQGSEPLPEDISADPCPLEPYGRRRK